MKSTAVVGLGIILCGLTMVILQKRFDASDHAKAIRLVRHFQAKDRAETFEDFLRRTHGGEAGTWESDITGGCRGVVQVHWTLPGSPPTEMSWDVDLPAQTIHPSRESPAGERALRAYTGEDLKLPPMDLPPLPDGGARGE